MKNLFLELTGREQWLGAIWPILFRHGNSIMQAQKTPLATFTIKSHRLTQFTRRHSSTKLYAAHEVEIHSKTWPDLMPHLKSAQLKLAHAQVQRHLKTQSAIQQTRLPAVARLRKLSLFPALTALTCKILCGLLLARSGAALLFIVRFSIHYQSPQPMLANSHACSLMLSKPAELRSSTTLNVSRNSLAILT